MRVASWVWLLLAVPAVLDAAVAQGGVIPVDLTLEVGEAPGRVEPFGGEVRVPYAVEFTPEAPVPGEVRVVLMVSEPAGPWEARAEPGEHSFEVPLQPGAAVRVEGELVVTAAGDPAAWEPAVFPVRAVAAGHHAYRDAEADGALTVEAAWRPGLFVRLPAPSVVVPGGGGAATAAGELQNTGNGDVFARWRVESAPEGCIVPAPPEEAAPPLAPEMRRSIAVRVECERGWSAGALTLRFTHAFDKDRSLRGEDVLAQWDLTRERGWQAPREFGDPPRESPAPAAWALAVGAVAAAALRRVRVR